MRGAAFGLRQSLDITGAFLGPLLAVGLMLLWQDDFRAIFWVAVIPGLMAVALLFLGLHEPRTALVQKRTNPVSRANLKRLGKSTWWVIALGGLGIRINLYRRRHYLSGDPAEPESSTDGPETG